MKSTKKNRKIYICALSLVGGWACSHSPSIQEFSITANPVEEAAKFEADMAAAKDKQVNVLSPDSYKKAAEVLQEEKESIADKDDAKDILHLVAKGNAYLKEANTFSELARSNIPDVILARKQAMDAGAPSSLAADFKKADESLIDVTSEIESNNLEPAIKSRGTLQLKYMDLELRAIKHAKLSKSQEIIALARKEGAEEFAPRSLGMAEKSLQGADAFITANRHDTAQVDARSRESLESAEHLLKITRNSKTGQVNSSEETALQMEAKQGQLAQKSSANTALRAENENLESDKALNQLYEEARTSFTKDEAEVYKQGKNLMIRLRGLEFPVSKSTLRGSDFPLLAKVQNVIRGFGDSSVIVEGHTDSMGGKKANELLSRLRAEAVKEYFIANAGDESMHIQSIGYDFQKPLAENKTLKGRAQNRRVDVIIKPGSTLESSNLN